MGEIYMLLKDDGKEGTNKARVKPLRQMWLKPEGALNCVQRNAAPFYPPRTGPLFY